MITRLKVNNFTAFRELDMRFIDGVNVFIGENGTGKTHIMKMLYAAYCTASESVQYTLTQKIFNVFLPDGIGRLARRSIGASSGSFTVYRQDEGDDFERSVRLSVSTKNREKGKVAYSDWKSAGEYKVVYIPVKDMLANAPGFRSLYELRHIHFEEIYKDIIDRALLPAVKGKPSIRRKKLMSKIESVIAGRIVERNEHFYLVSEHGELEFTLLAEGYRKLGLLYELIQNETLSQSSILFWDEPEANLNPKLAKVVVEIILELQRQGVQIFIATHDYVILKELSLAIEKKDKVRFHSLYLEKEQVKYTYSDDFEAIEHSAIDETYDDLLSRDIRKKIGGAALESKTNRIIER